MVSHMLLALCIVQWGAVTVLLISAPVLGKVVRTGLERVIGTLAGVGCDVAGVGWGMKAHRFMLHCMWLVQSLCTGDKLPLLCEAAAAAVMRLDQVPNAHATPCTWPRHRRADTQHIARTVPHPAGGLVAYLAALADTTAVYVIFSGLVALVGHVLGGALGYEYSGRLFGITYLIIAPTAFVNGGAHVVVISRVAGVLSGIAVTFLLSCIWFPTPASEQVGWRAVLDYGMTMHAWQCNFSMQLYLFGCVVD